MKGMDSPDDPVTAALVEAIQAGDLDALYDLLEEHAGVAGAPIPVAGGRTPLHVVTDWPGYLPSAPAAVRMLVAAGADPDARGTGPHPETPLHWAASSDDVDVATAPIEAGADIEAPGASIADGTPVANAVGYGCWHVARLLVERGARVNALWQAAALGMTSRVDELLAGAPGPTADELTEAFYQVCAGGQRRTAARLLALGADVNGRPGYAGQTVLEVVTAPDTRRSTMADWLREQGATGSTDTTPDQPDGGRETSPPT